MVRVRLSTCLYTSSFGFYDTMRKIDSIHRTHSRNRCNYVVNGKQKVEKQVNGEVKTEGSERFEGSCFNFTLKVEGEAIYKKNSRRLPHTKSLQYNCLTQPSV